MRADSQKIYHNIEQNKKVEFVDDVVEAILVDGFRDGYMDAVWFSDKPIACSVNGFTGVVVEVPAAVDLTQYEQEDDVLRDEGFTTYAIPAIGVNTWPREQPFL